MSGIEVSPETIFLYATSEATRSIPGLAKELAKSTWRSDKGILDYDKNGMPMLVLRDIIGPQQSKDLGCQVYMTSSDLNCDAHTIVTQQLINYGKTSANPLEIEFPKDEGRGAVFQIAGVPFHQYNSYSYNDSVCEKLGLFKVDKDQMFLRIRVDTIPGFILVKDPMDKKYSRIPAIEKRQRATKGFGYNQVLMIPLDHYADTCLEVQQQTDKALRIEKQDGSVATDAEIEAARKFLRLRMQHDKKTVPSLATVAASSAPSPKLKAREVAPAASKQAEAERID
jgi:hypothetical protein